MDKGRSALDIAKLIIHKSYEKNRELNDITNMKLLKLLYFAHVIHLVKHNRALFTDTVEAWKYGPSIDSVYEKYKEYKAGVLPDETINENDFTESEISSVDSAIDLFDKYSARELCDITHKHNPWKEVYKEGENHIPMSNESIKEYYADMFVV